MKFVKGFISVLFIFDIVLYLLGKRTHNENKEKIYDPEREYMLFSICPIGYGFLKIIPFVREIYIDDVYSVYRSRYDDEQEIDTHYQCFLAQQIAILCVFPLLGSLLVMYGIRTGETMNIITSMIFAVGSTIGLSINGIQGMKKKEKERIEKIKEDLPNLINRVVIFLNSGMPMVRVFQNVGTIDEESPLAEELQRVNLDIINHKDVVYALSRMQRRCPCYEVSRLYSVVEIAVNKGASGVSGMLTSLALVLWEAKRNKVKTKSSTLSQKLLMPTMVLFAVVVVLTAIPAFISLKTY